MNMSDLKTRLLNSPHLKDIVFNADAHTYFVRGEQYYGYTGLIGKYKQPFDKEGMSKYVAFRDGKTQEEVLAEWAQGLQDSIDYGTPVHNAADDLINTGEIHPDYEIEMESIIASLSDLGLTPLLGEYLIFNDEMKRASSIDLICVDENGTLVVCDYKTPAKGIKFDAYKNKKMLYPLSNIEDSTYNHYSLQISLYIRELAKLGFDVDPIGYILYIRESQRHIYPTTPLFDEVNKLIQIESFNK